MSYSFRVARQTDSFAGSRGVSSVAFVSGLWRITLASNEANVALGKLFEIRSSTTTANNKCWTIIWQHATTPLRVFAVAETMTAQGASGNGAAVENGTLKVTATAVTSFVSTSRIQATGALFQTRGVVKGDRLAIYAGALNRGSYYISAVIDENNVDVVSLSFAAAPLSTGGLTGETLVVYDGFGVLTATNEAAMSWSTIKTAYPFLVDSSPCGDKLTVHRVAILRGIILKQTGATHTDFTSSKEVILPYRSTINVIQWTILDTGGVAASSAVVSGTPGSDGNSFSQGSYWMGGSLSMTGGSKFRAELVGSVVHGSRTAHSTGTSAIVRGCLYDETTLIMQDGEARLAVQAGNAQALLATSNTVDWFDVFMSSASTAGFLTGGDLLIENMLVGDDAPNPLFQVFADSITIRNPKADYSLARLFSIIFSARGGIVDYTWNPRFVSRDSTGLVGSPIQGITVTVSDINGTTLNETAHASSPLITDANGRINGGAGINLWARRTADGGPEYSQRIRAAVSGYRALDMIIKMTSPFSGDVPIDFLATDFEGEVST